jgi:hypothetical protein
MPAKSPKGLLCGHPEGASRGTGGRGRPDDLDPGGRLSRPDERARQALRSIRRSLVSAPAADHRRSRWSGPAAGWSGARVSVLSGGPGLSHEGG